jgi:membrane fusion protein (multidrug efflux system)
LLTGIDPHDYQVAVEQARANLAQAQAQVRAEATNVPIIETSNLANTSTAREDVINAQAAIAVAEREAAAAAAKVGEAEANNAKAQADVARYKMLVDKDEVSRQEYDQAVAAAKAAAATLESYRASAASAQRVIEQRRAQLAQTRTRLTETNVNAPRQLSLRIANVAVRRTAAEAAKAELEQALLKLSYCKIFAPVSGIVTRKNAEVGQRVNPGQQLMYLVQIGDLWVTANLKETQLRRIRPGQPASIKVDALQQTFDGYVDSISGATGARTSLLPPENATGNFVKVVQRLPVRIRFKPGQAGLDGLRPGMSVTPKVTTK